MRAQRSQEPLDRRCGMFFTDFITIANIASDLCGCFATFQTAPHEHCCLVQCVVTLGIQIDEHCFPAVELGIDNVTVRMWCGWGVQAILFSSFDSVAGSGRRDNYRERASITFLSSYPLIAPGDFSKTL